MFAFESEKCERNMNLELSTTLGALEAETRLDRAVLPPRTIGAYRLLISSFGNPKSGITIDFASPISALFHFDRHSIGSAMRQSWTRLPMRKRLLSPEKQRCDRCIHLD